MGRKPIGKVVMTSAEGKRKSRANNPNYKALEAMQKKDKRKALKAKGK